MRNHAFSLNPKKQAGYIKEQGSLHEISAKNVIGEDAVNLNDLAKNFPTYDISSSNEIASVKSHMHYGTELTGQDINYYIHDFNHMLGSGRAYEDGLDPIQHDAKNIASIRDIGAPVPESLQGANQQEIGEYLKHNSVLRIPDDHVDPVQKALELRIQEFPQNYFLEPNPTGEQVQSVLARVKGTGLNSAQTLDQLVENQSPADRFIQDQAQNVSDGISPNPTHQLPQSEIGKSVGEIAGNVAAGPAGGEVGKVVGEFSGKAQEEAIESVGQSTEDPVKTNERAAKENPSASTSESDEEQNYGYGYGY